MTDSAKTTCINAIYSAFNRRDSSFVVAQMTPNVRWPRAFEGDFVHGQDAVQAYWKQQWQEIDPHVEPQSIHQLDDGRFDVTVHQIVRDLSGNLLADVTVHHFYEFDGELIAAMEVVSDHGDSVAETADAARTTNTKNADPEAKG